MWAALPATTSNKSLRPEGQRDCVLIQSSEVWLREACTSGPLVGAFPPWGRPPTRGLSQAGTHLQERCPFRAARGLAGWGRSPVGTSDSLGGPGQGGAGRGRYPSVPPRTAKLSYGSGRAAAVAGEEGFCRPPARRVLRCLSAPSWSPAPGGSVALGPEGMRQLQEPPLPGSAARVNVSGE